MAACWGYLVVAVSELEIWSDVGDLGGSAIVGGNANNFELRRRLAAGDKRALISAGPIVVVMVRETVKLWIKIVDAARNVKVIQPGSTSGKAVL